MSLFILLLLAHALADFVLQTKSVYKFKVKSLFGVFLHSLIFFVTAVIITFPLSFISFSFVFWLMLVTMSHAVIDKVKLIFSRNIIQKELIYFAFDQLLHILAILTIFLINVDAAVIARNSIFYKLLNIEIVSSWKSFIVLCFISTLLIYVSYAIEVVLYYYERSVNENIKALIQNPWSMLYRAVTFIILIMPVPYNFLGLLILAGRYFFDKWRLVYDKRRYIIENVLILSILLICFLVERIIF